MATSVLPMRAHLGTIRTLRALADAIEAGTVDRGTTVATLTAAAGTIYSGAETADALRALADSLTGPARAASHG